MYVCLCACHLGLWQVRSWLRGISWWGRASFFDIVMHCTIMIDIIVKCFLAWSSGADEFCSCSFDLWWSVCDCGAPKCFSYDELLSPSFFFQAPFLVTSFPPAENVPAARGWFRQQISHLRSLHCCLELVMMCRAYLSLPSDCLRLLLRSALEHFNKHGLKDYPTFCLPLPKNVKDCLEICVRWAFIRVTRLHWLCIIYCLLVHNALVLWTEGEMWICLAKWIVRRVVGIWCLSLCDTTHTHNEEILENVDCHT